MRLSVVLAFAIICVVWGSTYLAIRFVVETAPPFLTAGARWITAGLLLYSVTRLRGASRPSRTHWISAFIIGGLMLLVAHGSVVWAEQWIPSGLTSILVATVPLWVTFVESVHDKRRPSAKVLAILLIGFAGVITLIGDMPTLTGDTMGPIAAIAVLFGAAAWGLGSVYSRSAKLPESHFMGVAMQMNVGGVLLLLASLATGEWTRIKLENMSQRSLLALIYLIVFGSLVAFTSYIWLLKQTAPTRVATYAYVNPVVALVLGWALASEQPTPRSLVATVIILISVAIVTSRKLDPRKQKP
jgi:drug/metabolite transporter (DMT)-like permease